MADPDIAEAAAQTPTTKDGGKTPSCVVCQRRKVKCDRQDPCSACTRNGAECIYRAHLPPRRRKRRRSDDIGQSDLHGPRQSDLTIGARPQVFSPATTHHGSPAIIQPEPGMLIAGAGRSVYVDGNLWNSVRTELPHAEDMLRDVSAYTDSLSQSSHDQDHESSLVLGSKSTKKITALHPPTLHIFKLWQIFLDNVNPLVKILHGPTIQQQILEATGDLTSISKGFEALMFSIYCVALVSIDGDEAQKTFGENKTRLLSKYRRGARLALSNAGILRTSDIVVLQAFVLFLLSMRAFSDPQTIWSLCGLAVRMAQRIGLHRDGSQHGLSVFETEMRRRLWLQLSILDTTTAHSSGITPQLSLASTDVHRASNINDCDLDPRMTDPPRSHSGATEMIFCLARSEYGEWIRRWTKITHTQGSHAFLSSPSISLADKDRAIDELSHTFDTKYLCYCDTSIPFHYMTTILIHSLIYILRFSAHHPRQYTNHISPTERAHIFSICLRVAENCHVVQNAEATQRYIWHAENHIPWEALICMLYELRHRVDDDETRKAWGLIDRIYTRHFKDVSNRPKTAFSVAMQNLIIKAWKAHSGERTRRNKPSLPCPEIVSMLSEPDKQGESWIEGNVTETRKESQTAYEVPAGLFDVNTLDLSPMDWGQWDGLLEQFQQFTNEEAFSADVNQ
ncbi:fungal-specific transcription factor domain protein [Aspergillus ellipticus CBS 707.79]|uniref:Fungal-specific transcription factor domain protein n=1 Tax=Aspergillus ellipticus CBS 707.79 TaxID=1448320 RepID=A0A319CUV4_9EURO|nr:fungal-specific transcription factor domain protein [Aspergillus ellipticus CBS 707.79]